MALPLQELRQTHGEVAPVLSGDHQASGVALLPQELRQTHGEVAPVLSGDHQASGVAAPHPVVVGQPSVGTAPAVLTSARGSEGVETSSPLGRPMSPWAADAVHPPRLPLVVSPGTVQKETFSGPFLHGVLAQSPRSSPVVRLEALAAVVLRSLFGPAIAALQLPIRLAV